MSKRIVWNDKNYRALVGGKTKRGLYSLRDLVTGFEASDGYDLRNVSEWTPAMKRRVRDYYHRVEKLGAQAKEPRFFKSEKKTRQVQQAFHGEVPSKNFKAAFVPTLKPRVSLPGAKVKKPKVTVTKTGVNVQTNLYNRQFVAFDPKALARDPRKEIARAAAAMPKAKLFYAQVSENQSITGMSLGILTSQILQWISQYDGKKALPRSSGNYGDSPKSHHWRRWLAGMVGFTLPKGISAVEAARRVARGMAENRELKRKRDNFLRAKGRK